MSERVTAVLGAGVIGSSWVEAFRAAGHRVRVWDPAGDRGRFRDAATVSWHATALEAVEDAQFVQESGPENLDAKRALFADIEAALPDDALVASSTSTLLASDLQRGLGFADRLLIGHPFNPPHILPLVEVVGGALTSEPAVDEAMAVYTSIGKSPIRLNVERPGHLANRLQAALWREAVDAVASGQASVRDVDAAVTLALGPRWAVVGPFATFSLAGGEGGLAHFFDHLGGPFEELWDDVRTPNMTPALRRELIDQVDEASAGRSSKQQADLRDRLLGEVLLTTARMRRDG